MARRDTLPPSPDARRGVTEEPLRPTTNRSLAAAHLRPSLPAHALGLACRRADAATLGVHRGTSFYYNDHCDSILREFPALVDPDIRFVELSATHSSQFHSDVTLPDVHHHNLSDIVYDYRRHNFLASQG